MGFAFNDNKIRILDHGYVKLVESWGSDERVIEAARMSTNKGFEGWGPHFKCRSCGCKWRNNHDGSVSLFDGDQQSCAVCENATDETTCSEVPGDERLLGYLYRNNHSTPFEMAGMVFEVQAPIMVFREWHRHRTQSYNEMSARYVPLPKVDYAPTLYRCTIVPGSNKQAGTIKDADELTPESAVEWLQELAEVYEHIERVYQSGLKRGIPKELARLPISVARYSRMRASANLRNWLAFLTLRMAPNAQWEIRQYAEAIGELVREHYPRTWSLFIEQSP